MEFFGIFSKPAKVIKNKIEDKTEEIKNRKDSKIDIDIGTSEKSVKSESVFPDTTKIFSKNADKQEEEDISKVTEKFMLKKKSENASEKVSDQDANSIVSELENSSKKTVDNTAKKE